MSEQASTCLALMRLVLFWAERVVEVQLAAATLGRRNRTKYQYDARGNRTVVQTGSSSAGGEFTRYTYDDANRLLTETDPLNNVTTYTYDAAGNRQTKLDGNGHLTTYGYDFDRRLNLVSFDDGTSYQFDYDSRGNRILEKGPSHERHLAYDDLDRLQTITDTTFGKTITFGYDERSNRTAITEGTLQQHFAYDARNLLQAAWEGTGPKVTFGYDELGRRLQVVRPNGVTSSYAYDDGGELLSLLHQKAGQTLVGFAYTYDERGRRTSRLRIDNGSTEVYSYDLADRLTRVDYPAFTATYSVDELGNRTQETGNFPGSVGENFNAFNQLTRRRNATGGSNPLGDVDTQYTYDNNGNLVSESTSVQGGTSVPTTYTWDRDNRLRQVVQGVLPVLGQPGGTTSYSYDANGLRITRTDPTGVVNYLVAGPSVLEELNSLTQPTTQLLNHQQLIDDVIAFDQGGATYFPLTDALGSVYAIANSSGAICHRYEYDVWGMRADLGGSGPSIDFGYTGRWHDRDGLIDHRDRQRNPNVGGWQRPDRRAAPPMLSQYAYADVQPTFRTDPSGFDATEPDWIINHIPPYLWTNPGLNWLRWYTFQQATEIGKPIAQVANTALLPPNGDTLDTNIAQTVGWFRWGFAGIWWPLKVVPSGEWDYWGRLNKPALNPFTQMNVGATGSAAGYADVALLAAGDISQAFMDALYLAGGNPTKGHLGLSLYTPLGYSDDPEDKAWIEVGILYFYFVFIPKLANLPCK